MTTAPTTLSALAYAALKAVRSRDLAPSRTFIESAHKAKSANDDLVEAAAALAQSLKDAQEALVDLRRALEGLIEADVLDLAALATLEPINSALVVKDPSIDEIYGLDDLDEISDIVSMLSSEQFGSYDEALLWQNLEELLTSTAETVDDTSVFIS